MHHRVGVCILLMRLQYTYKTSEDKVPFELPITPSYVYLSEDVKTYSRVPLNKTEKKDDGGSACINVDMVLSIFRLSPY